MTRHVATALNAWLISLHGSAVLTRKNSALGVSDPKKGEGGGGGGGQRRGRRGGEKKEESYFSTAGGVRSGPAIGKRGEKGSPPSLVC